MLNFLHLKYFFDAATSLSFSEAAKLNFVSRSAISQAIRALEDDLGEELFHHGKNRAILTEKGKWLAEQASDLIEKTKSLQTNIKSAKGSVSKPVTMCCSNSLALHLFSRFYREYKEEIQDAPINLFLANAIEVRRKLEAKSVDFGIAVDDGQFVGFEEKLLFQGNFVLAGVKNNDPFQTFLVGDRGREVDILKRWLAATNRGQAYTIVEVQSWTILADMCRKKIGIAWIPDFLLTPKELSALKISQKLLKPPAYSYSVKVFLRNYKLLSENAQTAINILESVSS